LVGVGDALKGGRVAVGLVRVELRMREREAWVRERRG